MADEPKAMLTLMEHDVKAMYRPQVIYTSKQQGQFLNEPTIIICNHQTFADSPLVLTALRGNPICYLVAEKMFYVPILGAFLESVDSIKIRQNAPQTEWFKEASERLRGGSSVLIYPEGHQNKNGVISQFQPGFLMLAAAAKAPILPVYLEARYRAFDKQTKIYIGQAVRPENPSMNVQYIQHETIKYRQAMLALQDFASNYRKEESHALF